MQETICQAIRAKRKLTVHQKTSVVSLNARDGQIGSDERNI
jgi:hypothetical protein